MKESEKENTSKKKSIKQATNNRENLHWNQFFSKSSKVGKSLIRGIGGAGERKYKLPKPKLKV